MKDESENKTAYTLRLQCHASYYNVGSTNQLFGGAFILRELSMHIYEFWLWL